MPGENYQLKIFSGHTGRPSFAYPSPNSCKSTSTALPTRRWCSRGWTRSRKPSRNSGSSTRRTGSRLPGNSRRPTSAFSPGNGPRANCRGSNGGLSFRMVKTKLTRAHWGVCLSDLSESLRAQRAASPETCILNATSACLVALQAQQHTGLSSPTINPEDDR